MSELIEHAKVRAREAVAALSGPEDDIRPMVLWLGPHGLGMMPMQMPDDAAKDALAVWMTASLTVSRADEAVAVSTAYMAPVDFDDPTVDVLSASTTIPARDRPGRIEAIVLQYANHTESGIISAELGRRSGKPPTLGEWSEPIPEAGGRFGSALYLGLKCSREMPEEMKMIIEAGWEEGPEAVQNLIERFVSVAQAFQAGPPDTPPTGWKRPPPKQTRRDGGQS